MLFLPLLRRCYFGTPQTTHSHFLAIYIVQIVYNIMYIIIYITGKNSTYAQANIKDFALHQGVLFESSFVLF